MPWLAEVKQIFVRRCDKFGAPLTGVVVVTKTIDSVDVELLKCDSFTKDDHVELQKIIKQHFDVNSYNIQRLRKITRTHKAR